MQMSTTEMGDALVVKVEETRIDAAVAVRFKDKMLEHTETTTKRIILDLEQVEFLDSSGLGAVVGSMKQMGRGRRLDLVGLSPNVDKVFRMTRMDSVFRIFDDVESAVQDIAHAS
ncbi:MAG: STAS domain-containing protein [Boseongicola sp.]|nr:STAS domain-containing protein [Boseongicola sp.]MDD9976685.1 STAS domain-containing protein [Boseongicola sp.]